MKYIVVCGGVISGVGKGIIASSIGTMLKLHGLNVTSIKIDPYLNIDAGTFSPYEHGEVFVLSDGGEVDLDLGNYERFLDVTLSRDHNITTGKIYQSVIERERRGDYLGKTVQVVPHITEAIQDWIVRVAKQPADGSEKEPDVCVIELGGTIGDIESMPFVEAFRQFQFKVPAEDYFLIHVSLVPIQGGDQKTKPTQHSVRELRGLGLSPDVIICRCKDPVDADVKSKIAMFCHVGVDNVLSVHDCPSIYHVPLVLEKQKLLDILDKKLHLKFPERIEGNMLQSWEELAKMTESPRETVKIALVGKYTQSQDTYCSLIKALQHSCLKISHLLQLDMVEASDLEPKTFDADPQTFHTAWQKVCAADGILVPGGFGDRGIEGMIAAAKYAREHKVPYFGVCLGFQIAVIEFCRHVLGMKGAHSTEMDKDTPHPVVIDMPEISKTHLGGTMRLGTRRTIFVEDECITRKLYGNVDYIEERHRHRYEVNPTLVPPMEEKGLRFVGRDTEGDRMEIFELKGQPYYVGVQFHPEYLTRPLRPSPVFLGFILASSGLLEKYLSAPSLKDGLDSLASVNASLNKAVNGACSPRRFPSTDSLHSTKSS